MTSFIRFMHYRDIDDRGNVLPQGGTTVAYEEHEGGTRFAVARCSPYDNYNKAYGRAKSSGRLKAVGEEAAYCEVVEYKGNDFRNFMDHMIMSNGSEDFNEDDIPF